MKLLIMHFYSTSYCFPPLRSKCFPELYFEREMLDFVNEAGMVKAKEIS